MGSCPVIPSRPLGSSLLPPSSPHPVGHQALRILPRKWALHPPASSLCTSGSQGPGVHPECLVAALPLLLPAWGSGAGMGLTLRALAAALCPPELGTPFIKHPQVPVLPLQRTWIFNYTSFFRGDFPSSPLEGKHPEGAGKGSLLSSVLTCRGCSVNTC